MRRFAIFFLVLVVRAEGLFAQSLPSAAVFESRSRRTPTNCVDAPVLAKLKSLGIRPAAACSDSAFVRRVYLDAIGTLPAAGEVKDFLADTDPNKRRILIDRLLDREEFADYQTLLWCDLLRVKSEFPINLWPNAAQAYHRWIRTAVKENKPYDRFVRELLTASGSNFRVPPVNFYRALRDKEPETVAGAVALTFMGTRVESWPKERLSEMALFFRGIKYKKTAEWKEEIVFVDLFDASAEGIGRRPAIGVFPDGARVDLPPDVDRRRVFAEWLTGRENPWFARNVVNRIWYRLFGIGIIHEPDDIRDDNPPANCELLAVLERELVEADYDLKHVYRLILNSATYQRSCIATTRRPEAARHFAHYSPRRLDAEVLIDAICSVTGTHETYSSLIPEPWTFIPTKEHSIRLADGSITSPFLDLFGRPARATGFESERNNAPTPSQKLHLLNSSHIRKKIESKPEDTPPAEALRFGRGRRRFRGASESPATSTALTAAEVTEIYLKTLSRYPTKSELATIARYAKLTEGEGSEARIDLIWALINTPEFLYRH